MPRSSTQEHPSPRRRIADWFDRQLATSETDEATLADEMQLSVKAVTDWCTGRRRPHTHRLVDLASALDADLTQLCDVVERPAHPAIREVFASDPDRSLPGLLRSWQVERDLGSVEASEELGLAREGFSRLVAGSSQPSPELLARIADQTQLRLVELADGAYPGDDDRSRQVRRWARQRSQGWATTIRHALERHGGAVDALAGAALAEFAGGSRRPTLDDAVVLARTLDLGLEKLLVELDVDFDAQLLDDLHDARAHLDVDGRTLVADARRRPWTDASGHNRSAVSWPALAEATGMSRGRVIRVVRGDYASGFTITECLRLADALGLDRPVVLGGFGHHV